MVQTSNNPFEYLANRLDLIDSRLADIIELKPQPKIVDDKFLSNEFEVTRQTLARWRKQGRIPFIQVGSIIRYDLNKVIEALESKKG